MSLQDIKELFHEIMTKDALLYAVLSSPLKKQDVSKVTIRPISSKNKVLYQWTEQRGEQALHSNLDRESCLAQLQLHHSDFKQGTFYTSEADFHLLTNKKGHHTILKKPATKAPQQLSHNRQKEYLLEEGKPVPFLIHLGVMNKEGKVYPAKKDKFRQINRYLEMIEDTLPHLDSSKILRIVDFGCGKAYLTFALYHFLKIAKKIPVQMVGIDLKRDVIQHCEEIACTLGYKNDLRFIHGDINAFEPNEEIDLVVSLHACDTATDAALEKAIRWLAKVILCVPCCQHELMKQVSQDSLEPLLKHGILKERFAALATDAGRVQLLDVLGYQAQIMEFIDLEHTPKNLLIRAYKRSQPRENRDEALDSYLKFKSLLNITPDLERRFHAELFVH